MPKLQKFKYRTRPEFLALRKKIQGVGDVNTYRVGASEIGTLMGVNEYKSARILFYEATEYVTVADLKKPETHRGSVQENFIYQNYWRYLNPEDPSDEAYLDNWYGAKKVYRTAKKSNAIYVNEKYPQLFVSPDYEMPKSKYNKRGVLEIKSPTWRSVEKFESGVPTSYVAQVFMQMLVTGVSYGEIMQLLDSTYNQLFVFSEIPEGIKDAIIEKSLDFQRRVLEGKKIVYNNKLSSIEKEQMLAELAPDDDQPLLFKEFIMERHRPENALATVEGDGEQLQTVISYLLAKEEIKKLTTDNTKLENEIREYFKSGIGYIDFGGSAGKISYVDKLNVPARILKKFA
jgi:predicted phage-related endonuclease